MATLNEVFVNLLHKFVSVRLYSVICMNRWVNKRVVNYAFSNLGTTWN